mmetsp:Transcript_13957/g.24027  ORF Transcript_13957/g.24027 Transcript_13957/m.24027 type:complete len:358 (+) Transcript_13957:985-2058(+)
MQEEVDRGVWAERERLRLLSETARLKIVVDIRAVVSRGAERVKVSVARLIAGGGKVGRAGRHHFVDAQRNDAVLKGGLGREDDVVDQHGGAGFDQRGNAVGKRRFVVRRLVEANAGVGRCVVHELRHGTTFVRVGRVRRVLHHHGVGWQIAAGHVVEQRALFLKRITDDAYHLTLAGYAEKSVGNVRTSGFDALRLHTACVLDWFVGFAHVRDASQLRHLNQFRCWHVGSNQRVRRRHFCGTQRFQLLYDFVRKRRFLDDDIDRHFLRVRRCFSRFNLALGVMTTRVTRGRGAVLLLLAHAFALQLCLFLCRRFHKFRQRVLWRFNTNHSLQLVGQFVGNFASSKCVCCESNNTNEK